MVATAIAVAPRAFAHANLLSSEPASGARLEQPPSEVMLRFSEQPQLSLSDVQVLATDGTRVDQGKVRPGPEARSFRVGVKKLSRGTYTVAWHCVSKVDGHATAGSFAFGVGVSPSAPKQQVPVSRGPNPLEAAGRFAFIVGVFLLFGGAVVSLFALGGKKRLRAFVGIGGVVGLAGVAMLALAQQRAARAGFGALLLTPIGRALLYRAFALAVGTIAIIAVPRTIAYAIAAAGGAGAIYAEVIAGHAAAVGRLGGPLLHVAAQVAHFAAGAVWIGGLGALIVATRRADPDEVVHAAKRYSLLAAISLGTVAVTGAFRAFGEIDDVAGLLHSSYGYVVIAKSVLLLGLAALGARQRFVNLPKVRTNLRGLVRVGKQELVVATAILVATGVLTALSPPPPASATAQRVVATGRDFGRTADVRLEVTPGQAGINTFVLHVLNGFRPDRVTLHFAYAQEGTIGPSELSLRHRGDRWTRTASNLSLAGRWTVTVVLQAKTNSAEVPLQIATRCLTQTVPGGKGPVIHMQTLAGGNSDQTYADPGTPGRNEIHFTFFDPKGNELGIYAAPNVTASSAGRSARVLAVRRFSKGHFIASGRLQEGDWRFDADAEARGTPLRACFEQRI